MPQSFSITDIGLRREINQDYIFASDLPLGTLSCLYLVADGMGGHRAGDYASKYTVETVVDHVARTKDADPELLLREAFRIANTEIRRKAGRRIEFYGMGTTLVSCTICGDTRAHSLVSFLIRLHGNAQYRYRLEGVELSLMRDLAPIG